jgi:8-hydroxy-5-deazaflavin:NADPH oxidoreductase
MDITVIGTGNMGRGITTRVLAGGHRVTLLGTDADSARSVAEELSGEVEPGTVGDPLSSDVVVLAVWYPDPVHDVLDRYGDQLDGKVVVDISNPIDPDAFEPLAVEAGSVAQEVASTIPAAKVVKAFNTTFASTLEEGEVDGQALDVLLASDDDSAKQTVAELAKSSGLRPVDAGPLKRAHELEALGYLHMALQEPLGKNFGTAVKVIG